MCFSPMFLHCQLNSLCQVPGPISYYVYFVTSVSLDTFTQKAIRESLNTKFSLSMMAALSIGASLMFPSICKCFNWTFYQFGQIFISERYPLYSTSQENSHSSELTLYLTKVQFVLLVQIGWKLLSGQQSTIHFMLSNFEEIIKSIMLQGNLTHAQCMRLHTIKC